MVAGAPCLTGAGRSVSMLIVHSHTSSVSAGCCQEASVPLHIHISLRLCECPYNRQAGIPRVRDPRESKEEATMPFMI